MATDRKMLLQVIQPSLTGLMDGSVSTIGPIFAAGLASGNPNIAFIVGLSASFGAALSDNGEYTDRGHPVRRGLIVGASTFFGGILHTLPFLIPNLHIALYVALLVVGFELITISFIRYYYFGIKFYISAIQVIGGGLIVLISSFLIAKL
jgi:VIT1/CCC1 family predicted Fe2+/Mn2+ transporter